VRLTEKQSDDIGEPATKTMVNSHETRPGRRKDHTGNKKIARGCRLARGRAKESSFMINRR
jgi:hypothetical protein